MSDSSSPGLTRASTSFFQPSADVDGRDKPGHDGLERSGHKPDASSASAKGSLLLVNSVMGAVAAMLVILDAAPARSASDLGEAQFRKNCAMCHSLEPGRNRLGPSLFGVLDRRAGTVAGFNYSSANKNSGLVWTRETLDAYLADPQTMVPGTLMVFPGIKNGGDRQALVEFLASQHD